MEEGLHESRRMETVLIGAGLPCVANDDAFVACLQRQRTRFSGLEDILSFPYADGILILYGPREITDGHIRLPEIRSLARQYQRIFSGPSQNRFLRLNHAKTLPELGTIMNLKINVHDIVFLLSLRSYDPSFLVSYKFPCKSTTFFSIVQINYRFLLKKSPTTHGSNVFMAHRSTPAKAAFTVPNTAIAHAPRAPASTIGTFGVTVTKR